MKVQGGFSRTAVAGGRLLRVANGIGLTGLVLFAFNVFGGVGGANAGLGLMLLGLLLAVPRHGRLLWADPLVRMTLAYVVLLGIYGAWSISPLPVEARREAIGVVTQFLVLGFLPITLVGYWVGPRLGRGWWPQGLLLLVLLGFLFRLSRYMDLERVTEILHGMGRATFSYSAISLGAWCACTLLGLVMVLPRLRDRLHGSPWLLGGVVTVWFALLLFFSAMLVYSLSRAAWLAAVLVIPLTVLLYLARRRGASLRRLAGLATAGAAAAVVLGLVLWQPISQRVLEEAPVVEAIWEGRLDRVPAESSLGIRARLYGVFADRWWQHPWLGAGPGASERTIASLEDPVLSGFVQFHNSYFDIVYQFGLVGLGAFVLLAWWLVRAWRRGLALHPDIADSLYTAAGGLLIVALVALTDLTLIGHRGAFVTGLLGGIIHGAGWWGAKTAPGSMVLPGLSHHHRAA